MIKYHSSLHFLFKMLPTTPPPLELKSSNNQKASITPCGFHVEETMRHFHGPSKKTDYSNYLRRAYIFLKQGLSFTHAWCILVLIHEHEYICIHQRLLTNGGPFLILDESRFLPELVGFLRMIMGFSSLSPKRGSHQNSKIHKESRRIFNFIIDGCMIPCCSKNWTWTNVCLTFKE